MHNTKIKMAGAALVCAGIAISPAAQAASIIDLPQPGGNTVQVAAGGDKFVPQFALWPIPNQSNNKTSGNVAVNRGNNTVGQTWLFGYGAGNVVQFATGGNIINPQVAVGTDNHATNTAYGNYVDNVGNGNSSSFTGGQVLGHVIDGNGNVLQVEFLQGNIIAPQFVLEGDNYANNTSGGNAVNHAGNDSTTIQNAGMLAFLDGNGNVVQIQILSNNVIAPQFSVDGSNNTTDVTNGNSVFNSGNHSGTVLTGVFAVTETHTGNGNVTQISILSNNVWAPQIALPGPLSRPTQNVSHIQTYTNQSGDDTLDNGNGNGSTVVAKNSDLSPSLHPVLDTITGTESHPVLEKFEANHPELNKITQPFAKRSQIGNGNSQQTADNSGAISNTQINLGNVKRPTPIKDAVTKVVNSLKPKPKPAADPKPESSGDSTT